MYGRRQRIAFPLFLILAGTLYLLGDSGMVRQVHLHNIWPLFLIALGLEQIYNWSQSGSRR